jgi:hypothetical protein
VINTRLGEILLFVLSVGMACPVGLRACASSSTGQIEGRTTCCRRMTTRTTTTMTTRTGGGGRELLGFGNRLSLHPAVVVKGGGGRRKDSRWPFSIHNVEDDVDGGVGVYRVM